MEKLLNYSIIIPAKNEENNISRCLESILGIDYNKEKYEILVLDNGSIDRTVEIASFWGVKVFVHPGLTISALRNLGAKQANGRILVFLDADCSVDKNWLNAADRYLHQNRVVCYGSPPNIQEDATWVQNAWFQIRGKDEFGAEVEWLESMNMFVRRDIFLEIGGFDENLITCEDYDLSLRLKNCGLILSDSRIIAIHHGEAATISAFFKKEKWRGTSNIQGMISHGMNLKEIPSLLFPLIYILFLFLGLSIAGYVAYAPEKFKALVFLTMVLLWLGPIVVYATWKTYGRRDPVLSFQLFVLLNVYFCARGFALFGYRRSG